ncbi:cation diffusion facilitator family transporter [Desulfocicer vacuolatum DSM 3385]|uniref:Cation diffusion facilitator family transporter n=1 Tax=Desulfocicer vacuolatum DSM 3385 TaxID=1121400 RepID=A0A1W2CHC3_9BACT|nr:cation diffusion facilitator family transporter [Desulfocicer vacuolatum]SMC84603.1 cation diffusion facilitator family transporter [Desulfocicer vacuolatum DSM 3385]
MPTYQTKEHNINKEQKKTRQKKAMLTVNVGLVANTLLALLKTTIGIMAHSPALLADGINSTSDVAYGIAVNIFMRLSGKPADNEHPYGHEQLESIAAVVVGAFVITTAIAIFWNSINTIYELFTAQTVSQGASVQALWVALFTVGLKLILTAWTRNIGKQTQNSAVIALAADHRNDVFASVAATLGIFFGRMGYAWIDPLAGAVVSLIILHTGVEILKDAAGELMDTVPGQALGQEIQTLITQINGVEQVEEIKTHWFGPYLVANITIGVNATLTVAQGDHIATQVEKILINGVDPMRRVYVHYHPTREFTPLKQSKFQC